MRPNLLSSSADRTAVDALILATLFAASLAIAIAGARTMLAAVLRVMRLRA